MVLPLILPTRSPTAQHMATGSVHRDRTAGAVARTGRGLVPRLSARDAADAGEPLWRAIAQVASVGEA